MVKLHLKQELFVHSGRYRRWNNAIVVAIIDDLALVQVKMLKKVALRYVQRDTYIIIGVDPLNTEILTGYSYPLQAISWPGIENEPDLQTDVDDEGNFVGRAHVRIDYRKNDDDKMVPEAIYVPVRFMSFMTLVKNKKWSDAKREQYTKQA